MSYARARLWIGISAVGLNVLIASSVVAFDIPVSQAWVILAAYVIWMMPFDFLGGWWLPTRYGRSKQSLRAFLIDWAWGALLQSIVFIACSASILWASRLFGFGGGVVALLFCGVLLLALRPFLLNIFSRPTTSGASFDHSTVSNLVAGWGIASTPIEFRIAPTTGFTGGIVGLLKPQIVFPDHWRTILTPSELAALSARRSLTVSTGSYRRGLLLAGAWLIVAYVGGCWIAGTTNTGPQTALDLMRTIAGTTLCSFLGLLILPTFSRAAARRLDGMTVGHVPKELLQSALEKIDRVQDDEPHRPRGVELIFHPVPSVALRQHRELTAERAVPWNLARQILYLSWIVANPLVRAVHCNTGQSLLWIYPPTD